MLVPTPKASMGARPSSSWRMLHSSRSPLPMMLVRFEPAGVQNAAHLATELEEIAAVQPHAGWTKARCDDGVGGGDGVVGVEQKDSLITEEFLVSAKRADLVG